MKYKHLEMIMGVMITATSVGSTATAPSHPCQTQELSQMQTAKQSPS